MCSTVSLMCDLRHPMPHRMETWTEIAGCIYMHPLAISHRCVRSMTNWRANWRVDGPRWLFGSLRLIAVFSGTNDECQIVVVH